MASTGSPNQKQPARNASNRLTAAEIESLRAHKRDLHRQFREMDAAKAAVLQRDEC
jgi:hypothetical protein